MQVRNFKKWRRLFAEPRQTLSTCGYLILHVLRIVLRLEFISFLFFFSKFRFEMLKDAKKPVKRTPFLVNSDSLRSNAIHRNIGTNVPSVAVAPLHNIMLKSVSFSHTSVFFVSSLQPFSLSLSLHPCFFFVSPCVILWADSSDRVSYYWRILTCIQNCYLVAIHTFIVSIEAFSYVHAENTYARFVQVKIQIYATQKMYHIGSSDPSSTPHPRSHTHLHSAALFSTVLGTPECV